jgi:myosin heavy subunit
MSFSQLCINYCNEKLQFHFNEHIFRLEQNLYQAEGIVISSTVFQDNQPTLDLLEAKVTGIFSMTDEEINVPRGSDDGMLQKIFQKHAGKHPNLLKPKAKDCKDTLKCFGILHYAGPVFYNVTNFLDKNKDQIHADIVGTLKSSTLPIMHALFDKDASAVDAKSRGTTKPAAAKTLGAQFKTQLSDLMTTLNATSPHFIRCMKPNDSKIGNLFTAGRMVDQLRYAGLVEVCRIRKLGYPVRREFEPFFKRYKCIVPMAQNLDALISGLVSSNIFIAGEWAKGNSKLFMRTLQSLKLEEARESAFVVVAMQVQKVVRRYLSKRKYQYWMKLIQNVKDGVASRSEEQLTYALDMSFELPWGGKHMKVIKDALIVQERLRQENRVKQLLQNAISAMEINSLRSAITAANSMTPPLVTPLISEAQNALSRLESELQVKNDLLAAIAKRSRDGIATLLAKAKSMGMDCNETRQGEALMARLVEEDLAMTNLKKAVGSKDINTLDAAISKCAEMGLTNPEIQEAKTLQERLRAEMKARNAVREAISTRQLDVLNSALSKATALGISSSDPDIAAGMSLSSQLQDEINSIAKLDSAIDSRNQAAIEEAIAVALNIGLHNDSCNSLSVAQQMVERMNSEKRADAALTAALAGSDLDVLSTALAEASRLGLTDPKVDEARSKLKSIGARSEAINKLSVVSSSDNLSDVEAALAEANTLNLMGTPEAAAVLAKRDRLVEEKACIDELSEIIKHASVSNQHDLARAVATAMRLNLSPKFPDIVHSAKEKLKQLGDEVQFNMKIEMASRNLDIDGMQDAIAKAKASGINTVGGEKKLQEVVAKNELVKKISVALEAKNSDLVIELLNQASALNVTGSVIDDAKVFAGRTDMVSKTYETFKKAEENMDLALLNEALQTAIELGLQTPEVVAAQKLREKLAIFEEGASEIAAATQVVVVRLEVGVVDADLSSLKAAIERAEKV